MDNTIIAWALNGIITIISLILLSGRGEFLIAGYNTMSKDRKARYDEKRLCRMIGCGLSIITLIMTIATLCNFEMPYFISWLIPWGLFAVVAVMLILMNTICKAKTQSTES